MMVSMSRILFVDTGARFCACTGPCEHRTAVAVCGLNGCAWRSLAVGRTAASAALLAHVTAAHDRQARLRVRDRNRQREHRHRDMH